MTEKESISIPEDESVEFKTASQGRIPSDIWEAVTAFANAEGGTIYFGVDPSGNRQPLSVDEIDSIQRDIVTSNSSYSYKINFAINHKDGVVSVYVPPAPAAIRPLYSLKRGIPKGAKVRVGSANVQVDDEWMRRFSIAAQGGAESIAYENLNAEEVLDKSAIEFYIESK